MSRIQQILEKAEREGSVRRTQAYMPAAEPVAVTAPAPTPPVDGHRIARRDEEVVPPAPLPRSSRPIATGRLSPLLVAAQTPHAIAAEQYRTLRTRLGQIDHGVARRVLLVTSPAKADGKSVTAANLALTMAQEFNRRVVLVDADLRRPSLHRLLALPPQPGLAEVLQGAVPLDEALVHLPEYQLTVLPAGGRADRQTELLGSQVMRRAVDALRSRFDRVVIDTPPALPLADVGVLAPMCDGLLLVVRAGVTPKPLIERAIASCDESRLLGLVFNDSGSNDRGYNEYAGARTA